LLLESADSCLDRGVERRVPLPAAALGRFVLKQAEQREVVADLGDGWAVVAEPVRLLRHDTSGALRALAGRWVPSG